MYSFGHVDARDRDAAVVVHLLDELARELDRLDVRPEGAAEHAPRTGTRASTRWCGGRSFEPGIPGRVSLSADRPSAPRRLAAVIKYIGSKRTLVPLIARRRVALPARTACDLFAGHDPGRAGAARARDRSHLERPRHLLGGARPGLHRGRTHRSTGARLGERPRRACRASGLRRVLHRGVLPPNAVHPAAQRPADRRDPGRRSTATSSRRSSAGSCSPRCSRRPTASTARPGLQMAYLKAWAPRSFNELELRLPEPVHGPARAPFAAWTPTSSQPSSTSTSSTSTRRTTSIRTSPTTTSGRRSSAGMPRSDTGSRTSGSTAGSRRAATTRKRQAAAALAELLGDLRAPWLLVSRQRRGFPRSAARSRSCSASAVTSAADRRRRQALRRRADRDLQPARREGRHACRTCATASISSSGRPPLVERGSTR